MNAPKRITFFDRFDSTILQHRHAFVHSFAQLWQTPIATIITLGVIALVMALPLGLFWISTNINSLTAQWNRAGELTLFLQDNITEEQVLGLRNQISMKPGIALVTYQSPDQVLREFQSMTNMGDVMAALESNPLPGVMVVQPVFSDVQQLKAFQSEFSQLPEVANAHLDVAWVERLNAFMRMLEQSIMTLAVLLGLGLLFVVGNTTRTAIAQRQQEILVSKLVGASDAYVCRPFLYTGIWYGLLGSVLSLMILASVGISLSSVMQTVLESYQSHWRPQFLSFPAMAGIIGLSVFLSMFGAWLAVRRHLYQIRAR